MLTNAQQEYLNRLIANQFDLVADMQECLRNTDLDSQQAWENSGKLASLIQSLEYLMSIQKDKGIEDNDCEESIAV